MKTTRLLASALALAAAAVLAADAPKLFHYKIDHRGLVEIPGVVNGGGGWGAINCVLFGPGWQYSAQDYAQKDVKKGNKDGKETVDGWMWNPGNAGVNFHEEFSFSPDKPNTLHVKWTIKGRKGAINSAKTFLFIPVKASALAGKTVQVGGKAFTVPAKWEKDQLAIDGGAKSVDFSAGGVPLVLSDIRCSWMEIEDQRKPNKEGKPNADCIRVCLLFPNVKDGTESTVEFDVGNIKAPAPPYATKDGDEWAAVCWVTNPIANYVKPGTILDFSSQFPKQKEIGEADRLSVDKAGHLVTKKGERVRLIGANLNFSANTMEGAYRFFGLPDSCTREQRVAAQHKAADMVAASFRAMGYNSIRFHHTDVTLQKGYWNHQRSADIDPGMLDYLDYLFAAMKKQGMYVTTDLYQMRRFNVDEIPGVRELAQKTGVKLDYNGTVISDGALKGMFAIYPPAFEAWKVFATKLLNHVNPYTGLAWKDDPALVFICPVNEDTAASVWGSKLTRPLWDEAFAKWKAEHPELADRKEDELRSRFTIDVKVKENVRFNEFLAGLGCKTLVTGANWWETKSSMFERGPFGIVDNHVYADHPQGWPQQSWNQQPNFKDGTLAYSVPLIKAPARLWGKPMAITEWNFCCPNKQRGQSGVTMGAYSAFQDWDALYRFAWSHDDGRMLRQSPNEHFDICNDPLNLFSERIGVLLFRRGDVSPYRERLCYGLTEDEAHAQGLGDMWGKNRFPHNFVHQGAMHGIGTELLGDGASVKGRYLCVASAKDHPLAAGRLGGNEWKEGWSFPDLGKVDEIKSDTGELTLLRKTGVLRVATPRTSAVVAFPKTGAQVAGPLAVKDPTTFTTVSASAMDGKTLGASSKVLLFHLTDVLGSGMTFPDERRHSILKKGTLPYVARVGSVQVALKSGVPGLRLYALKSDGTLLREVPAKYVDGAYRFTLAVKPGEQAALAYQLSKAPPPAK